MSVAGTLAQGAKDFAWFVRGVMGEDAYDKYLDHHETVHGIGPDAPQPMTKRAFWRDRTDRQESNPEGRCC